MTSDVDLDELEAKASGSSLTSVTLQGLKWSYLSSFFNVGLQVGVTAVLARVLTPEAFGVVAMAMLFLKFGQYFAQLGVGQAVVQRAELSDRDVRTAFTSAFLLGALFCALFAALAPLTAVLFPKADGVVAIARFMSLTFLAGGLTAATQGLLRRRFAFRSIALAEMGSYVLGYAAVGLALALAGFGAWALAIASVSQAMIGAGVYLVLCRADLGLGLHRDSLIKIYSFGGRVSLIGFEEFIASNLDTLWTARALGPTALGYYTRATNLAIAPLFYVTMSLWRVLLPAFSRVQNELVRLRGAYLQTITLVAIIVMPTSWGAAAAASEIVLTLLGPKWTPAIPVLRVLALAVPFILLTDFAAVVCEATAILNAKIAITAARIVLVLVLLAVLARYGIVGVAGAYGLSAIVTHVAYAVVTVRRLAIPVGDILRTYVPAAPVGVAVGLGLLALHAVLQALDWPSPAILTIQLAVGLAVLLLTLARAHGGTLWRQVRTRMIDAGYAADGPGAASWLIRRVDALS